MKDRTLTMAGLLVIASFMLFINHCTPSKSAARVDMPDIKTEVKGGKEVKLNVNIYFNDVHTRHKKAMYERRFTNRLKEIGYVHLRERDASLGFLRQHIDNTSVNYWLGLAETRDAKPFKQFAKSGVDFVVFFHGQLLGGGMKGALSANCKIYLIDTRELKAEEFSEFEYDMQSFFGVYNYATKKFYQHINTAFPEAYKRKVAAAR